MGEPVNTKKRTAVNVYKGKIDMHQRKQGELPKEDTAKKKNAGGVDCPAEQTMDLDKVDNDNKDSHNMEEKSGKDKEDTYVNIDFGKLHNDFSLIKDAKKKPGAGE